jgi:hypothetical protein
MDKRVGGALVMVALLFAICITLTIPFMFGTITSSFFWGLPIGILFGVGTCVYLGETWDPVNLRPKNPSASQVDGRIIWVAPIAGVLLSNLLTEFLPLVINNLILGTFLPWIFVTTGYVVVQALRHRPRG